MILQSFLRPSASVFKNGVCVFCQRSLLVRDIRISTKIVPSYKHVRERPAGELVARQLGRQYVSKDGESGPRIPTAILLNAYKHGRIKIQARLVERIMHEFEPVMKLTSSDQTLVELCSALGVELDKLTDVGALYLKSKHPTDRLLGRNLLLCASRAGSLSATIFLVYSAHIQGALKAVQLVKPKTHLKSSVQAGATSVQALVLQGKLYLDQKLYKEAASCFEKAIAVARQCKDNDDTRLDKFLRWIGFDMGTNDPNLDKRRPQDLGLDHVEAHIQLAILRGNHKIGGDGIANLRIAALKYDDPMAYYMLACRDSIQFSYKWLQYMLKAAASGYRSAMEEVADLLGFEEEDLEKMVPDKRVRDWVLHNPVYWTASKHVESPSSPFYNSGDPKNQRILRRYDWALAWQKAAAARAQDINLAYFNIALIQWAKANKMQEMKLPLRLVRLWRVLSLGHTKALKKARKVEMELKKYSEIEFRLREQHPMYREAADLLDCRIRKSASIEWLFKFLESIDDVPAGTWRWDKNKPL